ncbi:MAG TPA: hypothetical protein VH637_13445 [Streptosporangiaceae bacterium]|jgi:hypothetical protein
MRTATGLALLGTGAILAFAVHAGLPGFNLAVAGWILMLTGAAGMFIPARAAGWLRRQILVQGPRPPAAAVGRGPGPYPAALMRDPAALAAKILQDAQLPPASIRFPAAGRGEPPGPDGPGPA